MTRSGLSLLLAAFLLFCALGASDPTGAQPTPDEASSTIQGSVTRAGDGRPLQNAHVRLLAPADRDPDYGTATDSTGRFHLQNVTPGAYRLVVSYVGFVAHEEPVELPPGATMHRSIRLDPRALSREEIVVTPWRARPQVNPVTVSNVTADQIDRRWGIRNVPSLLSQTPSTTFSSENGNGIGYSTLRIRGFDQRRLAVSINGVPQNDPEDFNVFWVNLYGLQPSIEDIQVQRGAGSSQYGSVGIGGAINVATDPFAPTAFARARMGVGSFDTRRLSVTGNSGLVADHYVVNARFSRVSSDGYRTNAWAAFNRFFGGIARYGDRSTLEIQAFGGIQRDGLAFRGIPKSANADTETRRQNASAATNANERFHPPQVHVSHAWRFSPAWTLDQTAFWIKGTGYFDFGGTFRSADFLRLPEEVEIGGEPLTDDDRGHPLFAFGLSPDDVILRGRLDQNQIGWIPTLVYDTGSTETTLGLEARIHRSLRWGRIQSAGPDIPNSVVGPDSDHRLWQFRGEKIITSIFGSHLFRPVSFLAVQADVQVTGRRYRFYGEKTFDRPSMRSHEFRVPYVFVNPRLGATLCPDEEMSAYASIAWAHREPRLTQLYEGQEGPAGAAPQFERDDDGSFDYDAPLVEPEQLLDLELGSTLERRRFRLSANLFWMEFWDEIVPSGGVNQFRKPRTGNAERSRHAGLELEGAVQLGRGWTVSSNAMFARTRFVDFTEYRALKDTTIALQRRGNPIASSPETLANLRTSYEWRGLTASLHLHTVGRQYVDNSGGTQASVDADGELKVTSAATRSIDPYSLVNATLTYEAPSSSIVDGLKIQVKGKNLLDAHVLRHGFLGPGGPRFYPAATRNVFVGLRYTLR